MMRDTGIFKGEEQIMFALRELYQSYGYQQYQVSKFEEYDLYAQNRNFLASKQLLTFHDTNGKLMALKPDVTLSVIKNTRPEQLPRKLYYTENVYRVPKNAYGFREIMQTGLEYIGEADLYTTSEVVMLAAKSLNVISPDHVLCLSHLGLISGILKAANLSEEQEAQVLTLLGERNAHDLAALGLAQEWEETLTALLALRGPLDLTLSKAEALALPEESRQALQELSALCRLVNRFGFSQVELDFSLVGNTDYYQGLIFRGFVNGVPSSVLSGGRYDPLLRKMAKPGQGIGFAVYLDQLDRIVGSRPRYDVDVLLSYGPDSDAETVLRTAERLLAAGKRVRVQQEEAGELTYAVHMQVQGEEVVTLETLC